MGDKNPDSPKKRGIGSYVLAGFLGAALTAGVGYYWMRSHEPEIKIHDVNANGFNDYLVKDQWGNPFLFMGQKDGSFKSLRLIEKEEKAELDRAYKVEKARVDNQYKNILETLRKEQEKRKGEFIQKFRSLK
jgi:hypothetical protein